MTTESNALDQLPLVIPPAVLDACAVLSWIDPDGTDDRGMIDTVFQTVDIADITIAAPTVVEVAVVLHRKYKQDPKDLNDVLTGAGVKIVPFGPIEARITNRIFDIEDSVHKAEVEAGRKGGRLSLGDRIALAMAQLKVNNLVTSDQFLALVAQAARVGVFDYRTGESYRDLRRIEVNLTD